jgi:tetraacyldisaccharide 4'-kinase
VFPAGPLRAPLDLQLARAQATLIVGDGEAGLAFAKTANARGLAIFHGRLAPDAAMAANLLGVKVLAFAGIGRPRKFFETLERIGARIERAIPFPDHHAYRPDDARRILTEARKHGLVPVTTEKDMIRLKGHPEIDLLAENALTLPVQMVIEERAALTDLVRRALRDRTGSGAHA